MEYGATQSSTRLIAPPPESWARTSDSTSPEEFHVQSKSVDYHARQGYGQHHHNGSVRWEEYVRERVPAARTTSAEQ